VTYKRVSFLPPSSSRAQAERPDIGAIFETVNETFTTEMLAKQTKLNAIEASVRHATRALADKRQQVQRAQAALSVLEQTQQQCQNVQNLLSSVSELDWTGRVALASEVAGGASSVPSAFRPVADAEGPVGGTQGTGEDIALPNRGEEGALVQLRRMALWEDRVAAVLQDRIDALQGQGADKAVKYRRLVSLCTKVPVDRVDGVSTPCFTREDELTLLDAGWACSGYRVGRELYRPEQDK
jgi:hypothetical protein